MKNQSFLQRKENLAVKESTAPWKITESGPCLKANTEETCIQNIDEEPKFPPKKRKFSSVFCADDLENVLTDSSEVTDSSHVNVSVDLDPSSELNLVSNKDLENNNSTEPIKENNNT